MDKTLVLNQGGEDKFFGQFMRYREQKEKKKRREREWIL